MSHRFGYARVSTDEQSTALQTDALVKAKCDELFEDNGTSGTAPARDREGFGKLWGKLRAGDTVVVWKLDRLGRNTRDVLGVVEALEAQGVNLESIQDKIDTSGPMGPRHAHGHDCVRPA